MKPPYDITPEILKWVSSISEKIGEANALFLSKPSPQLRKQKNLSILFSTEMAVWADSGKLLF